MAFVVKIKYKDILRRLTIEGGKDGSLGLTFIDLVTKICNMFQISTDERLVLTYIDQDNDLVTIGNDHDLYDAWIIQKIDPLRIHVNTDESRIHELKEAMLTTAITNPHKNLVVGSPHCANYTSKEARSIMGNWCRKETSPYEVQDAVRAYRRSAQETSKVDSSTQTSFREDYDACCRCSKESVKETRFQRNDHSLSARKHHHRMKRAPWRDSGIGKLDARFVRDVTIFDGTELVCRTHFTKIWRLRNIGTSPWPHATQLVYTGGDLLGTKQSASIELPDEGLRCEEEINIAVDFVAPESPGRYVSHWRLQAPSGQKFGQRVWVLIKAVSE